MWLLSHGWVLRWGTSLNVSSRETTVEQTVLKSNPSGPCGEEGSRSLPLSEAAGGKGEVPWWASHALHGSRAARHWRGREVPSDIAPKAFQSGWKRLQLECLHWALFSVSFRMIVSRVSLEIQLMFSLGLTSALQGLGAAYNYTTQFSTAKKRMDSKYPSRKKNTDVCKHAGLFSSKWSKKEADRGKSTMSTTPSTCKGSFRTKLSKCHLKYTAWCRAQPRCSPVIAPAIPCFVVAAAVMKRPKTTDKLSEIMGLFHMEMIASFLKRKLLKYTLLCCLVFLNIPHNDWIPPFTQYRQIQSTFWNKKNFNFFSSGS